MRAILCHNYGQPEDLKLENIPSPVAGPGQVLVQVKAASVNYPDLLIIDGKYQHKPPMPFAPGSEIAGVITALGEDVRDFAIGDRVMAYVLFGGFVEEIAVDVAKLVRIPETMDFAQASAFLLTYGTALEALTDRGNLKAGETLLVLGAAGGIGIAGIEIGKVLGATVIAASSSTDKLAFCKERGADYVIDYTSENLRERLKEITGGKGVDMVLDPVGGPASELALRSTAIDGRFMVVGFASGEIPRVPLNIPLLKICSIIGVAWMVYLEHHGPEAVANHFRRLYEFAATGKLLPQITQTYPLEDVPLALRALKDRKAKGKIVILP